jgi:tripartite-type tricarboxylate transporter receptor subunit TctC
VPYDPVRDFAPVAIVADSSPFVVSAHPALPIKNLLDLIAMAKAAPGKYSYAVDMSSGYQVAFGQLLRARAGIDIVQVPYKSAPMMLQDTASGVTPLVLASLGAVTGLAQAGRLRMLAIAAQHRFPGLTDLPTVSETLPGFRVDGWFVLVAPAGTPAPIVQRVNGAVDQFLKDPEIRARMQSMGLTASGARTPEATGDFIRAEIARWRDIAEELNVKPQ